MNTEGPCAPRDQPEKESKREKEIKKKIERMTWGVPRFCGTGLSLYFSGKLLCCKLYTDINARSKVMQGHLL